MRLLVLGGTRFVGRAIVADALARGWDVTALNRGQAGALPDGVTGLRADRTVPADLATSLGDASWDLVVDTWAGAPGVARLAARTLAGRAQRWGYVSTVRVYAPGSHVDESSPLVDGDPSSGGTDYAADKRGAELAVLESFPDALICRAGLVLGPYENLGRLPWWLGRIARGGDVVAPGRPGRPLQHVDARDLASWLLSGLARGLAGAVDVVSRSGHATTEELLQACIEATGSHARLVWCDEDALAAAGAQPWVHLPCWVPESGEYAGFFESDASLAARTGLRCRPIGDTVADAWAWVRAEGPPVPPGPPGPPVPGLPPEVEARLLPT